MTMHQVRRIIERNLPLMATDSYLLQPPPPPRRLLCRGLIQRITWCTMFIWDPMPYLQYKLTSPYVHTRVDSNTFTKARATLCQSRPQPLFRSRLYPPVRDFGFGLCVSPPVDQILSARQGGYITIVDSAHQPMSKLGGTARQPCISSWLYPQSGTKNLRRGGQVNFFKSPQIAYVWNSANRKLLW